MTGEERIRVLIVDDVAETRENIRRLLQFEKDLEVVGTENSGRSGIEAAWQLKPDVVLMDINMPDMDGITATERIRSMNPVIQIVMLSVQGDSNYMRRAMLAGARDFLTKPPAVDELIAALRLAGKMAKEERAKSIAASQMVTGRLSLSTILPSTLGKIITIYSPKGGTGATTLAVNLAITLRSEDAPVLIVDGNLQFGDVAVFMNEQVRNSVLELAPRVDELDPDVVDEVIILHKASGVQILAAPPRPEYADKVTPEQFKKLLEYLRTMFHYIVVDTSSGLSDVVLAAMDASDLIVLITTQEIPAIKSARQFLDVAEVLNIDINRILFVMNRFDRRIGILPEKISESFKHRIVAVLPFDERVVIPSVNRGIPFMLGDRSKPISKGFLALEGVVRRRISELSDLNLSRVGAANRKKNGG
jgi:pilus assembly protein CpaE